MDDDIFDPRIVSALRDLPTASDELRELHLTSALTAMEDVTVHRDRGKWFGVAAAFLVALGGIASYRALTPSGGSGVSAALHVDSSVPVKAGTDAPNESMPSVRTGDCSSPRVGSRAVGTYDHNGRTRTVYLTDDSMDIIDLVSCTPLRTVALPATASSTTGCMPSLTVGTQLVGTYTSTSLFAVVLATESNVVVIGGPGCEELARVKQPSNP